jgi:hypothetical protein
MSAPEFEQWSSPYGEVKDLIDNIRLYSNLRIRVYELGLKPEGKVLQQEAEDRLRRIEIDIDRLVHNCKEGRS